MGLKRHWDKRIAAHIAQKRDDVPFSKDEIDQIRGCIQHLCRSRGLRGDGSVDSEQPFTLDPFEHLAKIFHDQDQDIVVQAKQKVHTGCFEEVPIFWSVPQNPTRWRDRGPNAVRHLATWESGGSGDGSANDQGTGIERSGTRFCNKTSMAAKTKHIESGLERLRRVDYLWSRCLGRNRDLHLTAPVGVDSGGMFQEATEKTSATDAVASDEGLNYVSLVLDVRGAHKLLRLRDAWTMLCIIMLSTTLAANGPITGGPDSAR